MAREFIDPKTGTRVLVHEETGLAPVRMKSAFRGYNPDEVAGFEPAEAAALVAQGFADAVEPDEGALAASAPTGGQDRMVRGRTPRSEG